MYLSTAITHTPSMPVMVGRGLTDSLPTPGHRAPQDATAGVYAASLTTAATAKVHTVVFVMFAKKNILTHKF